MDSLSTDDVVVLGKSGEVGVLFSLEVVRKQGIQEALSYSKERIEDVIRNMDTRVPIRSDSLYFGWLKSIASPA